MLSLRVLQLSVLILMLCQSSWLSAEENWETDIQVALTKAKEEKKDLLMNFTGSDWCIWCIRLDKEVFGTEAFSKVAPENFILVKVDFPNDKSGQTEDIQKKNNEWQKKLGVNGFPSVYLVDSEGRPYAKTGYQAGGPEKYLASLEELRKVRVTRDEAFAKAEKLEGVEKAQALDEALSQLDESLATSFYADVIKQIAELDKDDVGGLRSKYYAAQDAEEQKAVLAKIELVSKVMKGEEALAEIEKSLKEKKLPPEMRIAACRYKLNVLRGMGKLEDSVSLLDEMLKIDGLTPETYQQIAVQKVYAIVGMKQEELALKTLDEMIGTTVENFELYLVKGELLSRIDRYEEAVGVYDKLLTGGGFDMQQRFELVSAKADALANGDKVNEAVQCIDDLLANPRCEPEAKIELLLQKFGLLIELDETEKAAATEKEALGLVEDARERTRLQKLFEQLRK